MKSMAQLWFGAVACVMASRTIGDRRRRGIFVRIAKPSAR